VDLSNTNKLIKKMINTIMEKIAEMGDTSSTNAQLSVHKAESACNVLFGNILVHAGAPEVPCSPLVHKSPLDINTCRY
jgi:hypothetical protein